MKSLYWVAAGFLFLACPLIVAIDLYHENEMFRSLVQGFGIALLLACALACFQTAFDEWKEREELRERNAGLHPDDEAF